MASTTVPKLGRKQCYKKNNKGAFQLGKLNTFPFTTNVRWKENCTWRGVCGSDESGSTLRRRTSENTASTKSIRSMSLHAPVAADWSAIDLGWAGRAVKGKQTKTLENGTQIIISYYLVDSGIIRYGSTSFSRSSTHYGRNVWAGDDEWSSIHHRTSWWDQILDASYDTGNV